jgi:hypothetical protein
MPAYARHATLVANVVSSFTVTGNPSQVEILSRNGLGEVYVSYDGTAAPTDPTVAGNNFDVIPAIAGASVVLGEIGASDQNVVKLISAAATTVSVRGIQ